MPNDKPLDCQLNYLLPPTCANHILCLKTISNKLDKINTIVFECID